MGYGADMSDTGEQGFAHQDPAQRAGVGGGAVPDDQSEGQVATSDGPTDQGATDARATDSDADEGASTGGAHGPSATSPKTSG